MSGVEGVWMRPIGWLCVALLAQSCGGEMPVTPSGNPAPDLEQARMIDEGTRVSETLTSHGDFRVFDLIAAVSGVLTVQLSWNPNEGMLELQVADKLLSPAPPDWSPLVAEICIAAGQRYRIRVSDQASWDYDAFKASFVLTTGVTTSSGSGCAISD